MRRKPLKALFGLLAIMAVLAISTVSFSQIKINEIGLTTSDPANDTRFIELFGPGYLNIGTYEIALVNGQTETSYAVIDLAGKTIPPDGYFVVSWNAANVPNTDLEISAGQVRIGNNSPSAVVLRQRFTKSVMDAVGYSFRYNTTPGTGSNEGLTQGTSYEGNGTGAAGQQLFSIQTGIAASTPRVNASIGRYPDGRDSGNNYDDFLMFYKGAGHGTLAGTPGQSNATGSNSPTPFYQDFAGGFTREWLPTFSDLELETSATAAPVAMPNSPDPVSSTHWASVKNNAGNGDEALMIDYAGVNYDVSGAFYCGPISSALSGHEVGVFGGRVSFSKNHDDDTGAVPLDPSWYPALTTHAPYGYRFHLDYVTGMIHAVKFDKNVYTEVGSTGPVAPGWHKLELNFSGPVVTWYADGQIIGQLNGELERAGYVVVGYRETVTGSGTVRNNFDSILVRDASQSGIADWTMY